MQLVEVKLLGELGRRFGRSYKFMASSPKDVISALSNQLEGFKEYLTKAHENGVGFKLVDEEEDGMDYEGLYLPCKRLIISPIVSGGGTVGRILLGVALVALSFVSFGAGSLFAGFAVKTGFSFGSGILFNVGIGLVLTGLAALLTPPVQTPRRDTEKKESFLFDRATELSSQGSPIPLLYGRFLAASPLVVSSAITTQQVPV